MRIIATTAAPIRIKKSPIHQLYRTYFFRSTMRSSKPNQRLPQFDQRTQYSGLNIIKKTCENHAPPQIKRKNIMATLPDGVASIGGRTGGA